jgi:ribosomal peptide maturation radical SAM protein 1
MAFRSKSPERALAELRHLSARYPGLPIGAVDNILDARYLSTVLPALAAEPSRLQLFYELKANLRKDHVRLLKAAGLHDIQPGIESLDDSVLRLMRKGVSALQNIQLLKWCVEFGVRPVWNILWGFPNEDPEAYERMKELVPLLTHLPPPASSGPVRIDRFSPLYELPDVHGVEEIEPAVAYAHLYPFSAESIGRLAYFFRSPAQERRSAKYTAGLQAALADWQRVHVESALFSVDSGDRLVVWDLRPVARSTLTELVGIQRDLYLACDRCRSVMSLERDLADASRSSAVDVVEALADLVERNLMVERAGVHLALAIPVGEYRPDVATLTRLAAAI